MTTDLELARAVVSVLRPNPVSLYAAGNAGDPPPSGLEAVEKLFRGTRAERLFGKYALLMAAMPLADGGCRWHPLVGAHRKSRTVRLPPLSAATRELLGVPCRDCLGTLKTTAAGRVRRAKIQTTARTAITAALAASREPDEFTAFDPASWRRWARRNPSQRDPSIAGNRRALIAAVDAPKVPPTRAPWWD